MNPRAHDDADTRGYDREFIDRHWRFACTVRGNDPELWRKDEFGAWICRLEFGNRQSQFGWEIGDFGLDADLSIDLCAGAGIVRHRPMQWRNYLDRAAARSGSRITADGLRNIRELL